MLQYDQMKNIIEFDEFSKMDLRIGAISECARKEGSEKLLRLTVDFGEEGTKIILSGLAKFYRPDQLIGKSYLFILNLAPRKMMGEESQGMILCADAKKPIPLKPITKTSPGTAIS